MNHTSDNTASLRTTTSSFVDRAEPVPVYRSRDLFRQGTRVHIEHDAGTYTLQITRQGKLILTK